MIYSDFVRAPCLLWDGSQEGSPDSGGSVEWGWVEDDLFEDAHQLIHGTALDRCLPLPARFYARVRLSFTSAATR